MIKELNFDSVFSHRMIVGLSSFFYDSIKIKQIQDGSTLIKSVPIYHSQTGSEQFLTDYFLNTDRYKNTLSGKVEGNIKIVPSGVFNFSDVGIQRDMLGSQYTRVKSQEIIDNDFGVEVKDVSNRGEFIPLLYDVDVKIKCGSDLERLKIMEAIIIKFYKTKKFFVSYNGFKKLPCLVALPDNMNVSKVFNFKSGENNLRPELVFKLELLGYMPSIDPETERDFSQTIQEINANIITQ